MSQDFSTYFINYIYKKNAPRRIFSSSCNVRTYIFIYMSLPHTIFSKGSHWPSDQMIRSWPSLGQHLPHIFLFYLIYLFYFFIFFFSSFILPVLIDKSPLGGGNNCSKKKRIGATICIGREILCLPCAGFLIRCLFLQIVFFFIFLSQN